MDCSTPVFIRLHGIFLNRMLTQWYGRCTPIFCQKDLLARSISAIYPKPSSRLSIFRNQGMNHMHLKVIVNLLCTENMVLTDGFTIIARGSPSGTVYENFKLH